MSDNQLFPSLKKIMVWNERQSLSSSRISIDPAYRATIELLTAAIYSGTIDESYSSGQLALLDVQKLLIMINASVQIEPGPAKASFSNRASNEVMVSLMRFMEGRYSRSLSLKEMAEHVHLNPSYLVRIFKSYSGSTPMQYLQTLRMNAAACYLTTTNMSIEQVASLCGFQGIHYFSQFFKKKFGESPSVWRQRDNQQR